MKIESQRQPAWQAYRKRDDNHQKTTVNIKEKRIHSDQFQWISTMREKKRCHQNYLVHKNNGVVIDDEYQRSFRISSSYVYVHTPYLYTVVTYVYNEYEQ